MAKHGARLLSIAGETGGDVLYEASVGGGIPIISPLKRDLSANEISTLRAIINGTTNYILTRMSLGGVDFGSALRRAQELGYAEARARKRHRRTRRRLQAGDSRQSRFPYRRAPGQGLPGRDNSPHTA